MYSPHHRKTKRHEEERSPGLHQQAKPWQINNKSVTTKHDVLFSLATIVAMAIVLQEMTIFFFHPAPTIPQKTMKTQPSLLGTRRKKRFVEACQKHRPGERSTVEQTPGGYQIFQQLRHVLSHQQTPTKKQAMGTRVLCILPFFTRRQEQAALDTYGSHFDGLLLLRTPAQGNSVVNHDLRVNATISIVTLTVDHKHVHHQNESTLLWWNESEFQRNLHETASSFDWIHWAQPNQYIVVDFLRAALAASNVKKSIRSQLCPRPSSFQGFIDSIRDDDGDEEEQSTESDSFQINDDAVPLLFSSWTLDDAGTLFHVKGIRQMYAMARRQQRQDDCGNKKAQTWNRAAMAQVLHFCAPQWIAPSWVLQCSPTSHLTCTQDRDSRCIHHYYSWDEDTQTIVPSPTQNGPEIWSTLQRYTQIMTNDMYRVDALLHGMCNDQWRQPAQALDSQGRVGYVYDPTELSTTVSKQQQQDADRGRTAFSSNNVCATPFGNGVEGPDGWNAMSNKIRTTDFPAGTKFKKVLCMVYTHESRHEPYLRAISETWGPKCDGFVAASSVTDTSIGAVRLLHEGPET
mmetsp:Transcript_12441/g.28042  ORF Transcript_12441/g.28042 Transcript_12441/m.28042 type:complete len:572 (+) Transcript_12441:52-1767(+)